MAPQLSALGAMCAKGALMCLLIAGLCAPAMSQETKFNTVSSNFGLKEDQPISGSNLVQKLPGTKDESGAPLKLEGGDVSHPELSYEEPEPAKPGRK